MMLECLIHQTASAAARNRDVSGEETRLCWPIFRSIHYFCDGKSLPLNPLFSTVLFEGRSVLYYCRRCLFCPERDKREEKIEGFLHNSLPGSQAVACCLCVYIAANVKQQQQQLDSGNRQQVACWQRIVNEAFESRGGTLIGMLEECVCIALLHEFLVYSGDQS